MSAMMIIALANAAVDLGIKLFAASQTMPDRNDPAAQAQLALLKIKLNNTLRDVDAYEPKDVG